MGVRTQEINPLHYMIMYSFSSAHYFAASLQADNTMTSRMLLKKNVTERKYTLLAVRVTG
jgi:hypothetical protein